MPRPISERVKDWKYWAEQFLHFALGGAIAYAFQDIGGWGSFGLSVFLSVMREFFQNLRADGWHGSKADAAVDVAFWTIGAALGSLIS